MSNCCNCLFIKVEDFYTRVPMSENIDSQNILIAIRETQIKFIKPLFCEDLYNEICEQILNGYISDANAELLCYIKDIHVRYAFGDFLFIHPMRVTKESVVRKVSDESEFVDFSTIEKHAKYWRLQAMDYIKPMYDWMDDNIALNAAFDRSAGSDCEGHNVSDDFGII